jgi:hypothetical protein
MLNLKAMPGGFAKKVWTVLESISPLHAGFIEYCRTLGFNLFRIVLKGLSFSGCRGVEIRGRRGFTAQAKRSPIKL